MKKWLVSLTLFINSFVRILWQYRVVTIGLLILYFTLWHSDQGIDLLANLNATPIGPLVFIVTLSVIAALYWHLPKYFYKSKFSPNQVKLKNILKESIEYAQVSSDQQRIEYVQDSDVARILGVLVFLIPGCAILNALQKFNVSYVLDDVDPHLFLLIFLVLLSLLFKYNWIENISGKSGLRILYGLIFIQVVAVVILGFFNKCLPSDLGYLSLDMFLMAGAFSIFVSIRRTEETGFKWIQYFQNQPVAPFVMVPSILLTFIFIIVCITPDILASSSLSIFSQVSTISILLCGLVTYSLGLTGLLLLDRKLKIGVTAFLLILSLTLAYAFENRFHDVTLTNNDVKRQPPELDNYIQEWLEHRTGEINGSSVDNPYPIFIVNAYGGGIRAAAWTSMVIHSLDQVVMENKKGDTFQNHALAYSGASGGTVGLSLMILLKKENIHIGPTSMVDFYNHDFLSPVLIGMFARDIVFSTFHMKNVRDRARLQEEIWTTHIRQTFHVQYDQQFLDLWSSNPYGVPLLFSNTYHVEKGLKGIVAPVKMDTSIFPAVVFPYNYVENNKDFTVASASLLSARFPFISPAGKLETCKEKLHFMDGGLKENAGAETAFQIYTVLSKVIGNLPDTTKNKIAVHFISLHNSPEEIGNESHAKNLFEILAPQQALYTNWIGNTTREVEENKLLMNKQYHEIRLTKELLSSENKDYTPVYPLGWQLSGTALKAMEQSLKKMQEDTLSTFSKVTNLIK